MINSRKRITHFLYDNVSRRVNNILFSRYNRKLIKRVHLRYLFLADTITSVR